METSRGMAMNYSRREFLREFFAPEKIAAIAALLAGASCTVPPSNRTSAPETHPPTPESTPQKKLDKTFGIEFDNDPELGFDELRAFALRMHALLEGFPQPEGIPLTQKNFEDWVAEVSPMFGYNGLRDIDFKELEELILQFSGKLAHNHVLGSSDCIHTVRANARYGNKESTWYADPEWLLYVIHELAHICQTRLICGVLGLEKVEPGAQIMMVEIASALALRVTSQGIAEMNRVLVYALLHLFQQWAIRSAYLLTSIQTRVAIERQDEAQANALVERFWVLHDTCYPSAFKDRIQGVIEQYTDVLELEKMLQNYSYIPLQILVDARRTNFEIYHDAIPATTKNSESHTGVPTQQVPEKSPFILNDVQYFLQNLEDLVAEIKGQRAGDSKFIQKSV